MTRKQVTEAGTSRQQRRTMSVVGLLTTVNHGVYRTVGTPPCWEQGLLAACLAAGPEAVASHRAAALLWELVDPPAPIEITVPYEHHPLPRTTIRHRSQALREVDRTVRRGIPVTTPARTLLDLGAVAADLVPNAIERCLHQGLLTTAALWRMLDELGGRGRRGTRALREALGARVLGDAKPQSLLEVVLADITATTGVSFTYQHPVLLDGHRYYLDFAVPELLLVCEADGLSAHGSRAALDCDLERQNRLVRHGWTILRYTSTALTRRRRAVRAEILAAIDRCRQHLL